MVKPLFHLDIIQKRLSEHNAPIVCPLKPAATDYLPSVHCVHAPHRSASNEPTGAFAEHGRACSGRVAVAVRTLHALSWDPHLDLQLCSEQRGGEGAPRLWQYREN